jgi:hypothetical protein
MVNEVQKQRVFESHTSSSEPLMFCPYLPLIEDHLSGSFGAVQVLWMKQQLKNKLKIDRK